MGQIPDELLLARQRRETAAREADIAALEAKLAAAVKQLEESISSVQAKLTSTIGDQQVNASALVGHITRAQVEPGFALAEDILTLEASVTDGLHNANSSIEEIRRVTASQFDTTALVETRLRSTFDSSIATITSTLATMAATDTALASRSTVLEATVNDPSTGVAATHARIVTEETARATADTAIASSVTTLTATVGTVSATLTSEISTRASADTALSTSITTLTASVGSLSSSITTEATARATADGYLSGKYSLKVTAGNIVTGMNITSSTGGGTDVSEVAFQASSFKIYDGSSATIAPFSVSGGIVRITNAVVESSLDVGTSYNNVKITGSGLNVGSILTAASNGSGVTLHMGAGTGGLFVAAIGAVANLVMNDAGGVEVAKIDTNGLGKFTGINNYGLLDNEGHSIIGVDALSCNSVNAGTGDITCGGFLNAAFNIHPSATNDIVCGEDGGTSGAATGLYLAIRVNNRTVWVPFFTAVP